MWRIRIELIIPLLLVCSGKVNLVRHSPFMGDRISLLEEKISRNQSEFSSAIV